MREVYSLSKDTIGRAYAMLRQNGFIRTDGTNGTIVTFDVNNPQHVAKVPLEWPQPDAADTAPYEIVMRLHGNTLCAGLTCSSEPQLLECQKLTEEILLNIRDGRPYSPQVLRLWMCMIAALENEILNRIVDHLINRYLYFVPQHFLSPENRNALHRSAQEFYEYLLAAIALRDFGAYPEQFERYYHNYYRAGGLVFSKQEKEMIFNEQALYEQLLEDLCIKIMVGDLRKGDTLPTTPQLCNEYGVSKTTVNRAYNILVEIGLIDRRVRNGTRLIAEPSDTEIRKTLQGAVGFYRQDWKDAEGALMIISATLDRGVNISCEVQRQMERELARQRKLFDQYRIPFSVFTVLISPVIEHLPAGILHKYYDYLTDILAKMVSLCTFRAKGNQEHGEEVYRQMCDALGALKCGDQTSFAKLSKQAIRMNVKMLMEDFIAGHS